MKSIEILVNHIGSAEKGCDPNCVTLLDFTSIHTQFISLVCLQIIETPQKYCFREKVVESLHSTAVAQKPLISSLKQ